jgi:benzoyl-CoA 2,3-dioxygenase component B
MFVGETGVDRVVQRTAELMRESGKDDPESVMKLGGIPLDMVQRHLNLWFSLSEDLFGSEVSSNAAEFFAAGLKGRYKEQDHYEDHVALNSTYELLVPHADGRMEKQQVPLRNAMNEVLRDGYVSDCQRAVDKWNRTLDRVLGPRAEQHKLKLPSRRFHRHIGVYGMEAGNYFDPDGNAMSDAQWTRHRDGFLPTQRDRDYVLALMKPVTEPGKIAGWVAPPARGINSQPFEFEYVKHIVA